ncbi:XrtA system polysaccharide deacetylase [Oceanibacterium hippocampi]|uniref:Chitooligosaccharide deacetylase n=1 Tax=Oceanibacterium hippocampi TaxID=745714 RepID=A0A1Y5TPQ5_9PROT|nr:XrtA system polysaccharide deacetylase [Oceanibacterium hippocampi]SLN69087.1 Polysaccharide deacetylase [Oceanibacterium hippocampi]
MTGESGNSTFRVADGPVAVTPTRESGRARVAARTQNALTIDVEDYFQVQAFADIIDRSQWDAIAPRVEANTERALELFDAGGAKATFFTLGWVAERYPALIRRIVAEGHELASHGMAHIRADSQDRAEFDADIRRAKELLEDAGGVEVRGYRAATFSIGRSNMWAYESLAEAGYHYSSSIYPVSHDLYGLPDASRDPFHPAGDNGVVEIPMSTLRMAGRNFPASGGGYFRLLPYPVYRWMVAQLNGREGRPCIFYFHPWEIDPDQPRQDNATFRSRFRHYTGLERMAGKLGRLLEDFSWSRMDAVYHDVIANRQRS